MAFGPTGVRGFGALPRGEGVNPDAVQPPSPVDVGQAIEDVHRIAEKYDGPPVENIQPFNLAAGQTITVDYTQTKHNAIIISIETGTVKLWIGSQTHPNAAGHLAFPAGGVPTELMMSTNGRYYTLGNDPAAAVNAVGCFWIERL